MNQETFKQAISVNLDLSKEDSAATFNKCEPAAADKSGVRRINTACRACISNCGVIATVKDGRVVRLEGDPRDPMSKGHMCAKGLSGIQALYNPNRNKYPMIRVGERGENRWKRLSWDEALDILADKLIAAKRDYGAESVLCSTGGGGNPEFWSIARFCNTFGTPNWFEPGCAQCYLPRMLIYTLMYGGTDASIADSNAHEIYFPETTPMKSLTLWGADPSYSSPAMGGAAVNDLRAHGVKTIVIDPRMTPDAAKATVWLPIRPGSDVALGMCWIKYIIDHKAYNYDFVMHWTNLPYLADVETKEFLRAKRGAGPGQPDTFMVWDKKTNSAQPLEYPWNDSYDVALEGTYEINGRTYKTAFTMLQERCDEYTIEKTANICRLPEDKILESVQTYLDNQPGGICIGVATDQSPNSTQAPMCTCAIDCLMGNVEKPGVLMQRFESSGVFNVGYCVPPAPSKLPPEQLAKRLGGNEYKGLHMWMAAHAPSILDTLESGKPYPIRVWIDRSGNKLGVVADGKRWAAASKNVDFICHIYMYPTSFSMYADMLLPAEEWLETDMFQETCNKLIARQAVTHTWETMDETVIWSMISKHCAMKGDKECINAWNADYMGDDLPYWNSTPELLDKCLAKKGLDFETLKKNSPMPYCTEEEFRHYYRYLDKNPATGLPLGFHTGSGKCEVYMENLITLSRTGKPFACSDSLPPASHDYDPLPFYIEPSESPFDEEGLAKEFPLVMTNGRLPMFHHGTLRNVAWTREMYPAPEVWVNPKDAEKYGIKDDEWVWVESLRGRTRGIAAVTTGIQEGTVYMERFWAPENLNKPTHGWQEMNVSMLARSRAPYNEVVGTYTLRAFLVKVYPAPEGAPEGVWTDPKQFKPFLATPTDPTPDMTKEGK